MQELRKSRHFPRDDVNTPSNYPINNSSRLSTKSHKLKNPRTRPFSQKGTMQTKIKPRRSSTDIVDTALFMARNRPNAERDNGTKCLCRLTPKLTRRRINQTHHKQTQGPNTILNMSARSADTQANPQRTAGTEFPAHPYSEVYLTTGNTELKTGTSYVISTEHRTTTNQSTS